MSGSGMGHSKQKAPDLRGRKFGKLTVTGLNGGRGNYFICKCTCKRRAVMVHWEDLFSGARTSCGACAGIKRTVRNLAHDSRMGDIGRQDATRKRQTRMEQAMEQHGITDLCAYLLAELNNGATVKELGEKLGVPGTIYVWLKHFGIERVVRFESSQKKVTPDG